jgi:hypothetical protein
MYAIIPAPGHHGDYVTIYSTHKTEKAAQAAYRKAGGGVRLLAGVEGHKKGERLPRGVVQDMLARGDWRAL